MVACTLGGTFAVAGLPASAQAPVTFEDQRIQFEPGTDNATREGIVDDTNSDRWTLTARAGQTMAITLDSADNNTMFAVFAPDRTLLAQVGYEPGAVNTFWEGVLPMDGDYQIEVASLGGQAYYHIKTWIDAPYRDPLGLVNRVAFAPGTDRLSVNGAVIRASADTWLVTARGGQTMNISADSPASGVTFNVVAPDGSALTGPELRTTWSGVLPADGDYRIIVSPVMGNAEYRLDVVIPGPAGSSGNNSSGNNNSGNNSSGVRRISFAPGTDNAYLADSIAPGESHTYLVNAAEGQFMSVMIMSDVGDIYTSGYDPNGEPMWLDQSEYAIDSLVVSGDHEIVVTNDSGIVGAYELWVYIYYN